MINLDLNVQNDAWRSLPAVEELVRTALSAAEHQTRKPGEVSVLLTNNAEMQRLNQHFRGKDKPTDVLSFPADEMDAPFLGDIAIGFEICAEDAAAGGKSVPHHLSHLIIHGYLHLLGFDHINDADAEEMETLERLVLASLGIADPYSAA